MRCAGKAGVVTGASRGLGRETLRALCGEGASVVALARDAEAGRSAAEEAAGLGGRAVFVQGDVRREEDVVAAINRCRTEFGELDFMMKTGVLGLTKAIAIDYALDGIRCNCVCPGDMETPMIEQYFDGTDDPVAARAEMEAAYPGKRIAHPLEVAAGRRLHGLRRVLVRQRHADPGGRRANGEDLLSPQVRRRK
jgi:NAD(P)-dependent dehydrogenase (short-subunit alcohol dehydrogenase family)